MSRNYHTPIVPGTVGNVGSINTPLSQLDTALSQTLTGIDGLPNLVLAAGATLTHNGTGNITITNSLHTVVQGTGANVISTINGGVAGDFLVLSCTGVRFSRAGNIYYPSSNRLFDPSDRPVTFLRTSTDWILLTDVNQFVTREGQVYPSYLRAPSLVRVEQLINSSGDTGSPDMIPSGVTITQNGTRFANITNTVYTIFQTATLNAPVGINTTAATITQAQINPVLRVSLGQSGGLQTNVNTRIWIGFCTTAAGPGNVAAPAGATHFHGIRFNTIDGDTTAVLTSKNAAAGITTQTTGVTFATDRYFELELSSTSLTLRTPTTEDVMSISPTNGQPLGYSIMGYGAAVSRNFSLARVSVDTF